MESNLTVAGMESRGIACCEVLISMPIQKERRMQPTNQRPTQAYADLKAADQCTDDANDTFIELLGKEHADRPEALMAYFLETSPTSMG